MHYYCACLSFPCTSFPMCAYKYCVNTVCDVVKQIEIRVE